MSPILANAVASIQLGIEDYQNAGQHRHLSALRNVSAGILLLFKEKLARMAPNEILIKKDARLVWRDGQASWVPAGDKTIDFLGIKERFKLVQLEFDFSEAAAILDQRNRIEHYVADIPAQTLRGTFARAAIVIVRFCREQLGQEAAALIGEEHWQVMLSEKAIHDAEMQACKERLAQVDWPYPELLEIISNHHTCRNCGSNLVTPANPSVPLRELTFVCAACGEAEGYASAMEPAFVSWASGENYISIKDGGEAVNDDCDQCLSDMVLVAHGYCIACGYHHYTECSTCGSTFRKGHYCEYCDAMDGQRP